MKCERTEEVRKAPVDQWDQGGNCEKRALLVFLNCPTHHSPSPPLTQPSTHTQIIAPGHPSFPLMLNPEALAPFGAECTRQVPRPLGRPFSQFRYSVQRGFPLCFSLLLPHPPPSPPLFLQAWSAVPARCTGGLRLGPRLRRPAPQDRQRLRLPHGRGAREAAARRA